MVAYAVTQLVGGWMSGTSLGCTGRPYYLNNQQNCSSSGKRPLKI